VQKADVSFRDKEAGVAFDPGRVTVSQLSDAVNRLGFRASVKANHCALRVAVQARMSRSPATR